MKRVILFASLLVAMSIGCQPKHARQSTAAGPNRQREVATTAPVETEFASTGIRLTYPGTWTPTESKEYALLLASKSAEGNSISLEIPKLPAHLPGLIPIPAVVNGYTDDLKNQHPGISIAQPVALKVAGANARRVRSSWSSGPPPHAEDAVLIVHDDHVYIFRANATQAGSDGPSRDLDAVLNSVEWE